MQVEDINEFKQIIAEIENQPDYQRPQAFGIGVAMVDEKGRVLNSHFPVPNFQANFGSAAVMAKVLGYKNGTHSYEVTTAQLDEILSHFTPFENDGKVHPNIEIMKKMQKIKAENHKVVVAFIAPNEQDFGPLDVTDAYLRLHLLSHGLVKPDGIKLAGIFDVLNSS
jgi:2,3,4,5-tetrahydropyridine-2-carboxylate N-succinyltransferase